MYISKLIHEESYNNLLVKVDELEQLYKLQKEYESLVGSPSSEIEDEIRQRCYGLYTLTRNFIRYNDNQGYDYT